MTLRASDAPAAMAAAVAVATGLGLPVSEATVVHASNRLAIRLLPAGVLARVAHPTHEAAALEVDLAVRLAATGSPVAPVDTRVTPRVYEHDGFVITFWAYYEPGSDRELSPADYADALARLHAGMRRVDMAVPHFTDRVREARLIVGRRDWSPDLADADRELLERMLGQVPRVISERRAAEQLLHGEPHPGNVLVTLNGPLFIDLETACRGPVEFDLAHVPSDVGERYPGIDPALLEACRGLVLAMVAAWRFDPDDQFPGGRLAGQELLAAVRAGPPFPTLGELAGRR